MVQESDVTALEERCMLPKPSLSRTITPGYMAAVMSSPEVLCNLCQQYFRQYDKNQNGFMECLEAVELAKDLGSTLAVPLGSTEEVLRPSLKRFSEEGRDALNLEEFCRWFPTVLGLEPLSPQHIEEIKSGQHRQDPEKRQLAQLAPSLQRSQSPGYVAALGSSPQTLQTFCKQLFREYNVNEKGVPQSVDAEKVADDLFLKLGLAPDEKLKARLKECLKGAHQQGSLEGLVEQLSELLLPKQTNQEIKDTNKGYVNALKNSPRTFVQLCRKYFREYDFNQSSFLDGAELQALARDFGEGLQVPLGSSDLRESISQFSDNGTDCLSLSEFIQWFGTMIGLEEPTMREVRKMALEL